MHPPRVKSAPVSRNRTKKTSAIKEIEEWVLGGKEHESGMSRIRTGQLAENITEERLLRAHMMELGKERFKILAKCDHEIQTFREKQKRKGLRPKFNRPQSATLSVTDRGINSGRSRSNVRSATPALVNIPVIRPKTVQFEADLSRGEYLTTGLNAGRPQTVPARTPVVAPSITVEEWTPLVVSGDWSRHTMDSPTQTSRPASAHSIPVTISNRNRRTIHTSIADEPRFSALAKSLSKNYVSDCKIDVPTIIRNTEALRTPTKLTSKEARRELELKIKLFMEENNIVF